LSQVVERFEVTVPRTHAYRWATYCARMVHALKNSQVPELYENWRDLLYFVNAATIEPGEKVTVTFPEHLLEHAKRYGYVARRLP
jgi:hypothetical protein